MTPTNDLKMDVIFFFEKTKISPNMGFLKRDTKILAVQGIAKLREVKVEGPYHIGLCVSPDGRGAILLDFFIPQFSVMIW